MSAARKGWRKVFGKNWPVPAPVLALLRQGLAEDLSSDKEFRPEFGFHLRPDPSVGHPVKIFIAADESPKDQSYLAAMIRDESYGEEVDLLSGGDSPTPVIDAYRRGLFVVGAWPRDIPPEGSTFGGKAAMDAVDLSRLPLPLAMALSAPADPKLFPFMPALIWEENLDTVLVAIPHAVAPDVQRIASRSGIRHFALRDRCVVMLPPAPKHNPTRRRRSRR